MEYNPLAQNASASTDPRHLGLNQAGAKAFARRGRSRGGVLMRIVPVLLVVGIAAAAFFWWRRSSTTVAAPMFRTVAVKRGDVTQTVTGSGSLSALTTVEVGSQVSGNILKLYADFNDAVKKGQVIAEIDSSTYQARLEQAENDLLSSRVTLELKQLNERRSKDLLAQKLIAQSDYDQVRADLRQTEALVKNREASHKSAQVDLERCTITSPIDGIVISRAIDVGQTVQASFSAPKLFTLAQDLRQMEITANISEADIGAVEAEQPVSFTVDAFPERAFKGKVRQVRNNTTTSNNVVTYPTIVTVDNSDLKLRPGMTANIVIATSQRLNVLRLPNAVLRFRPPESATVIAAAGTAPAGGPPGLDQLPPAVKERMLAQFDKNGDGKIDSEEGKAMEAMRARFAAAAAAGGGGGGGGGGFGPPGGGGPPMGGGGMGGWGGGAARGGAPAAGAPQSVTIYVVEGQPNAAGIATGSLQAVKVMVGVSDSANVEIISGVDEGAIVATGVVMAQAAAGAAAGTNNIFGPPRPPGMGGKK